MKRKWMAGLLTAAVVMGLAGCGSGNKTEPAGTTAGEAAAETTKEAADQKEAEQEKVELELFLSKTEIQPVMEELAKKFEEENPNIKINITVTSDGRTVLQTRLSTNEMPDLLNTYPAEQFYKDMFREGIMIDISDQEFLNQVSQESRDMTVCDGKYYALPYSVSAFGIYCNNRLFEQQGIELPTTYEELIAACDKFQAAGIQPMVSIDKELGNIAQRFERLVGVINNDSNSEFEKIAKGEIKAEDSVALNTIADVMYKLYGYSGDDSLGVDSNIGYAAMANEEAAMMLCGTWGLTTLRNNNPDVDVVLIPFPNPTGEKTNVPINVDCSFSVCTNTKHPEEATKFLEFLSRTENAQTYCDADGNPNLIKGVEYKVSEHEQINAAIQSGDTFLTAVNFWPNSLREELQTPVQQLFIDGDKEEFLQSCDAAIKSFYNQ